MHDSETDTRMPGRPIERIDEPGWDAAQIIQSVRATTSARLLVGRSGPAYRTTTQLDLRRDHAAALDAVHAEIELVRDFSKEFIERWSLFEVTTQAPDKTTYLMRPDWGRRLSPESCDEIRRRCPTCADLQVAIGDGLSATAAIGQAPSLVAGLADAARAAGWQFGQPFLIRYCRVGVLNDIGRLLRPRVTVLLIGERPGLATADSLSAYMAYRPCEGQTDADRNLISNIHSRGVSIATAVSRIMALAAKMIDLETSGVAVKEERSVISGQRSAVSDQR